MVRYLVAVVILVALSPAPASGQETREAAIAAQQADKATRLARRQPNRVERTVLWVERELILTPSGFYPLFGSVYNGSGFAAGAGYRYYSGDNTHWDAKGLYSIKGYTFAEVSADSWGHADRRVDLHGRIGYRDATQVWFHGVGLGTSSDDRTAFALTQAYGGADVTIRPQRFIVLGGGVAYEDFSVGERSGRGPSIEDAFTPEGAPGLGADPSYVHATASASIDWRPSGGYARHGGLYAARYHRYADRDDTYSFSRIDGEVVQHVPILRDTWVLSVRGLAQTTVNDDDVVPFFLLPSLGSGDTLRGFSAWRFRDRHNLLMSAEFRWTPNRNAMDMALFYDAGKVTSRRGDLNFEHLKSNVGIGVRFHGPTSTPLRIELARGNEGLRFVFAGSAAF
jgi:hypothetical protein